MDARPLYRLKSKTTNARVEQQNEAGLHRAMAEFLDRHPLDDDDDQKFWEGFADELEDHSRRAKKLAETVRTTKVVKKVAGRTVPNSTHYVQVTTKKSDHPFK